MLLCAREWRGALAVNCATLNAVRAVDPGFFWRVVPHVSPGGSIGKLESAREALEKLANSGHAGARVSRSLGFTCTLLGDLECAERSLQSAVQSDTNDRTACFLLGFVYQYQHRPLSATQAWRDCEAGPYFIAVGKAGAGGALSGIDQRAYYEIATGIDPTEELAYVLLIQEALHDGDFETAEIWANELLASGPEEADGYLWLGNVALRSGQSEKAANLFSYALGMDPDNPEFLYSAGLAYHSLGAYREAEQLLDSALMLSLSDSNTRPRPWDIYSALAQVYSKQNRHDDAVRMYNLAIELRPESANLRNSLARQMELSGQGLEAAQVYCDVLVELDPGNSAALEGLLRLRETCEHGSGGE